MKRIVLAMVLPLVSVESSVHFFSPSRTGSSVNQELPWGIWLNLQAGRTPEFKRSFSSFQRLIHVFVSLLPQWLARWFYLTLWGLQTGHERGKQLPFLSGMDLPSSSLLFQALGAKPGQVKRHSDCPISWVGWLLRPSQACMNHWKLFFHSANTSWVSVCSGLGIDPALARQWWKDRPSLTGIIV